MMLARRVHERQPPLFFAELKLSPALFLTVFL